VEQHLFLVVVSEIFKIIRKIFRKTLVVFSGFLGGGQWIFGGRTVYPDFF
jgi:hypothetical protein